MPPDTNSATRARMCVSMAHMRASDSSMGWGATGAGALLVAGGAVTGGAGGGVTGGAADVAVDDATGGAALAAGAALVAEVAFAAGAALSATVFLADAGLDAAGLDAAGLDAAGLDADASVAFRAGVLRGVGASSVIPTPLQKHSGPRIRQEVDLGP